MVYILIPAYNNKKEVLELLGCLAPQSFRDFRTVLVDDGSTDGTEQEVRRLYPQTIVLRGDGGLWWTGANYMGVEHILKEASEGDFILLLNNDLTVEGDYLQSLVDASNEFGRAIAGSTLVDFNNRDFMESGVKLDRYLNITYTDKARIRTSDYELDASVLPGRGTLVPVEVFKKAGNFNLKRLPHYGADYEFTYRARKAGYRLVIAHKARVFAKLDITGLKAPAGRKIISLKECYRLLASKKSTTNLRYYLNYVWLCSEGRYRFINTFREARRILSGTLGRTLPLFPLFYIFSLAWTLVRRVLSFINKFFFKGYPFRTCDIERFGLDCEELAQCRLLEVARFRGEKFYALGPDTAAVIEKMPEDRKKTISELERLSFSYRHKLSILFQKLRLCVKGDKFIEA